MLGNSIVTNKGYNANTGRITRINTTLGDNIFQDLIYSYDDFGNFALRRKMNSPVISETFTYDNINTTFDRGFCMHEHYRDFNLINMNGRLYDPLVGRMLSPDIVIQNPEYSQSYNRYSYCFNNPLKYIDPSGYRITDPPHTNVVINYVTSEGDVSNDLKRLLNFYGITDVTHATSDGYSGGTIRWSEGNYEYTYSYGSDINEGTLSCQYVGDYNINYNYPSFNTSESSYSIPQPNLPGNGGGCAAGIATATGTGASIGAEMFYSKTYKTWMGKNWKMYKQTWNGNQHTGGKLSYAQRNSKALTGIAYIATLYNGYELINERINNNISTFELCTEVAILIYSARGGIYGIAVGVGWELGRLITFTEAYQEFKFNLHYNMYENKFGTPSESNEYLWNEFYKNYRP